MSEAATKNINEMAVNSAIISELCGNVIAEISKYYCNTKSDTDMLIFQKDMFESFIDVFSKMAANPEKMVNAQFELYKNYFDLWTNASQKIISDDVKDIFVADKKDKRFKDEEWQNNMLFDFMKQSYLMFGDWFEKTINEIDDDINSNSSKSISFYIRHYIDAISPSNFLLTNPAAIKETIESNGENVVNGLNNFLRDLRGKRGEFHISMSDPNAFTLGVDIACTKGKVVFENDLMQLIQYSPSTNKVFDVPIFIISPWINKYYVLDMQQKNSFVKWLVDNGHTVFITSWVNPGKESANKDFSNYLEEGILEPLKIIEKITKSNSTNIIGYCLGGTLLSIALSYLTKKKQSNRVSSATFITTLMDFENSGELGLFVSDEKIKELKVQLNRRGYFRGKDMVKIFSMLRANDLIWSFVVNNYIFGKTSFPFDLLYWNSDSTNMPAAMHLYYLKNMYKDNLLKEKNGLNICDVDIDITEIEIPSYMIATIEDRIAPWKGVYASTRLLKGAKRFVLSGSGHVAGVVNPPSKKKYGYWTNDGEIMNYPKSPDEWFNTAAEHKDSWWTDWQNWITNNNYSGKMIDARIVGTGGIKAIEDAPGRYVEVRVDDIE